MMRRSPTILAGGAAALTLALPVPAASASPAVAHMAKVPQASNSRYVAGLRPGAVPAAAAVAGEHYLDGVFCTSRTGCWAVGDFGTAAQGATEKRINQVPHWNGKKWSRVNTPNPGGTKPGGVNEAFALGCWAAGSCWAAGTYGSTKSPGTNLNETLRWNGKNWTKATAPNPDVTGTGAANQLFAATCVSSANCWAVGFLISEATGIRNEVLHWNGERWVVR